MKKLIIFLILIALVLPVGVDAIKRPTTLLERCTLRHDWTEDFGAGYEEGQSITSVSVEETAVKDDFPTGGMVDISSNSPIANTSAWFTIRTFLNTAKTVSLNANCKSAAKAVMDNDPAQTPPYTITDSKYNLLDDCGTGMDLPMKLTAPSGLKAIRAVAYGITSLNFYREDAAIVCMLDLLVTIGDWIFIVVMILAVIFLVLAGYTFVTGAGAPEKITKARNMLIWGLVGVGVAILARGLITLVEQLIT